VHRFLPGRPLPLGELPVEQLGRLTSVLACLHRHTSNGFTPWPEREPREGSLGDLFRFRVGSLENYASFARGLAGALDPRLPDLLTRLTSPALLNDASWDGERFARLHGDLSFGNILWSESEVALIDWEFSRVGDPAEDLGYLLSEQPVRAAALESLREQYARAGGDERVWSRVPAYVLFTAADSALWWADYPETPALDAQAEIERRITTALNWLPAPEGHA
jgi:aminoglycoside phosphotransferase (APT) family kinase protein